MAEEAGRAWTARANAQACLTVRKRSTQAAGPMGAGEVCLWAGLTACLRHWEPDVGGHDRPIDVTRTAPYRSGRIIRRVQVHD